MIDLPTAMVLIGSALQALSPAHRIASRNRRWHRVRDLIAVLPLTPLPRTDPSFARLFARVAAVNRP